MAYFGLPNLTKMSDQLNASVSTISQSVSDVSKNASQMVSSATETVKGMYTSPQCCVCESSAKVQCFVCERFYCTNHQIYDGIDRKDKGYLCKEKDKYNIPRDSLDLPYINIGTFHSDNQFACCFPPKGSSDESAETCKDKVAAANVKKFEKEMETIIRSTQLKEFFDSGGQDLKIFLYDKPGTIEDTLSIRASKLAYQTAKLALDYTGYSEVYFIGRALLMGVEGKVFYDIVQNSFGVDNDMISLLQSLKKPILFALDDLRVSNVFENTSYHQLVSELLPTIVYLSQKHILDEKISADLEVNTEGSHTLIYTLSNEMEKMESCSSDILDTICDYVGPANWLYATNLPGIHNEESWTRWYLQKVVLHRDQWTLIGCNMTTREVPKSEYYPETDPKDPLHNVFVDKKYMVPAFGIFLRQIEGGEKEALIVIRGTNNMADWTINLNMVPDDILYPQGEDGSIKLIEGKAHSGMLRSAKAILEHCHLNSMIDMLLENEHSIKLVGHSLGAGIASLAAVLLKFRFWSEKREVIPKISAIGFGAPPNMSEDVVEALSTDGLVLSIVNQYDVVSRLSVANFITLANEVVHYREEARRQLNIDVEALTSYTQTLGKAARMNDQSASPTKSTESEKESVLVDETTTTTPTVDGNEVTDMNSHMDEARTPKNHANNNGKSDSETPRLFVPGKIVILGRQKGGVMKAGLTDHRSPALKSLKLMNTCVSDHAMAEYARSLRGVYHQDKSPSEKAVAEPRKPIMENAKDYAPCGICGEDLVWPFITKSLACRATNTHNCAACGIVVCTVCAPAGDKIPGDGVNTYDDLEDMRVVLPALGIYTKTRVCRSCYFVHAKL